MPELNLPSFAVKARQFKGIPQIYDAVRKKFVFLSPEEWVRQHLVNFLIVEKKFPIGLIAMENALNTTKGKGRTDIRTYRRDGNILMVAECKAADIIITEKTLLQLAVYNYELKAPFLLLSNGIQHVFARKQQEGLSILDNIPTYEELCDSL